jgi:hypothetical protein
MEPSPSSQRPAARKEPKTATDSVTKSVALDGVAHASLTKTAKKRGVSNARYASAAILYFTENGLDPLAEGGKD